MGNNQFIDLVERISAKNPLQARALRIHLAGKNERFWQLAGQCTAALLAASGGSLDYIADSYLELCREMITEQIKFKRTGRYSAHDAGEVDKLLYSSDRAMTDRIYALALSQFLWPNHYALFCFFLECIEEQKTTRSYLEIGPGHGLHLAYAFRALSQAAFTALDISEASLRVSQKVIHHLLPEAAISFEQGDVMTHFNHSRSTFDIIVMNEVLEHLDDPLAMLRKLREMLSEQGRLFITTCCNAPTIDHVFLYTSVEHIRMQIREAGLRIELDKACPVGDYSESEWAEQKVEVNYSALLTVNKCEQ